MYRKNSPITQAVFLALVLVLSVANANLTQSQTTTIYIVRHTEKAAQGRDPDLSSAGQQRADALAHTLQDAGIQAVYVTGYKRSQQSAAPLVQALGIAPQEYPASDAAALAQQVLAEHGGASVLVVGHSNTVAVIAAAFGVEGLHDLDENNYDRLWVVHHQAQESRFQALRYGAASP